MSIRKLAAFAAISSLSSFMLFYGALSHGDTLSVDDQLVCDNISTVYWENGQLTVTCGESTGTPSTPSTPSTPDAPSSASCPGTEPNTKIERFSGRGIEQEFVLSNESVLAIPFNSGDSGAVRKIALGEPANGEHFKKTVIISKCPGVFNPDEYDFTSSVDVCALTGLELSFSIISGEKRSDYPLSSYRCVLEPNQPYYLSVFQRDAGNRPPYTATTTNTCRTNKCGVRVSIR